MATPPTRCPVCGTAVDAAFLVRKDVPVHQNLLFDTPEAARAMARGALELAACSACGFIFNRAFDERELAYGARYENTQGCSPAFARHMQMLAGEIVHAAPEDAQIIEIGSGKGSFLRGIVQTAPGAHGIGFDPSHTGDDVELDGRLRFERRLFGADVSMGPVDVVICRHVIEHIAEPEALLHTLRGMLAASPDARLYFETPCVEWILRNRVVWDVFYEHCSYFSAASLSFAFGRAGFIVTGIRHVFAGQYLWLQAVPAASRRDHAPSAGAVPALALEFARDFDGIVERWRRSVEEAGGRGKVAAWGAGAKGVTLANLVDPQGSRLDCLIDLNPEKQGHFVPGAGQPIVDPATAAARGVRTAILVNPNYLRENAALIDTARLPIELQA